LRVAREALAASLLAGKTIDQIHGVAHPVSTAPPPHPQLEAELLPIAHAALAAPAPQSIAVIRSSLAASLNNPSGRPDWARGAKVLQSHGPFVDSQGVLHWVDQLLLTLSVQFTFSSDPSPFGVFPVYGILPPHPRKLSLGAGSVWFLADLLSASLTAGGFTGFTVTGGELTSSSPMDRQDGAYTIPDGATLTAKLTLAPAPMPSGSAGQDAAAASFTPPANVTIVFDGSSAALTVVDDSSATAYGTTVHLHWNQQSPSHVAGLPQVLIPCDPAPVPFAFTTVKSVLFTPSGSAPITLAGWALPLAATTISTLPEAGGPGAAMIEFGPGATIAASIEPRSPVSHGLLEIATGGLFSILTGQAKPATTTWQLWPLAPPSKLNATVDFTTMKQFTLAFLSTPAEELLGALGEAAGHLDRPLTATGQRFPYSAAAFLLQTHTATSDLLFLLAFRPDEHKPIFPLALTNALLGVDAPTILVVEGVLNGLILQPAAVGWYFNLRWLLPTLPDPYAANFDLTAIPPEPPLTAGTILAAAAWRGGDPVLGFTLFPPPQGSAPVLFTVPHVELGNVAAAAPRMSLALLDLSTRVDLFGVALAPEIGQLAERSGQDLPNAPQPSANAPAAALSGLWLELNSALVATFALPQCSWEPIESEETPQGPIFCEPPSDGSPLLICSPDNQKLVPFSPGPVLLTNIDNVAAGHPFAAVFSLPFGLNALITQPNQPLKTKFHSFPSTFLFEGGEFRLNDPTFPESFVPNPTSNTPDLNGGLAVNPETAFPQSSRCLFSRLDAARHHTRSPSRLRPRHRRHRSLRGVQGRRDHLQQRICLRRRRSSAAHRLFRLRRQHLQ
jgi:hypothetical protein